MDKQEVTKELADFLKFNSTDIFELGNNQPEVAEAFSAVIIAIDKKYGSNELTKEKIKSEVKQAPVEPENKSPKKIRFKTKDELQKELITETGTTVTKYPSPGWADSMDILLGKELSSDELKSMITAFKKNETFLVNIESAGNGKRTQARIAAWMLTGEPIEQKSVFTNAASIVITGAQMKYTEKDLPGKNLYNKKTKEYLTIISSRLKQGGKNYQLKVESSDGKKKSAELPYSMLQKLMTGVEVNGYFIKEFVEEAAKDERQTAQQEPQVTKQSDAKKLFNASLQGKRPSPTESAQSVSPNTVLVGNDGNNYIAKENKNGVNQWKKFTGSQKYIAGTNQPDYTQWSQADLITKYEEIAQALKGLEELSDTAGDDPEYAELEEQRVEIKKYIK